jgi:GT2 family glycosyltransferase
VLASLALSKETIKVAHVPFPFVQVSALIDEIQQLEEVGQCINNIPNARAETDKERKFNKVLWKSTNPLVSLIIPTKNGKALVKACIESILEKTTYSNYEILLIDNGSDEEESIEYFKYLDTLEKVTVLEYPAPFNYSAINNFGVKHANGSMLGLINNDIEVISPDWLTYMVGQAERESIGCVGAKLLYSDTRIQHAGVVLGYGGGAGHAHKNFPRFHSGYLNRINATSNYSAVTAACLLVKKSLFDEVGGLNEQDLSVAFNDVDFCLKVKELGVQNVYCAEAELFHHESVSRGLDISPEKAARFNRELEYLRNTWANYIANDPAYSPNLTLKRENFSIKTTEELTAR